MAILSPSILGCDYLTLADTIKELKSAGVKMLHLDVMDGEFVPNISFGCPVIDSIKKHSEGLLLDVHLMINKPDRYLEDFAKYADYLGIHYEAGSDVGETLQKIRSLGCKSCLTIKPKTKADEIFEYLDKCDMVLVMSVEPGFGGQAFMPSALEKLTVLKNEIKRRNLKVLLEVDGGVNFETGKQCVDAGADVLVVGSFLFKNKPLSDTAQKFISM